MSVGKLLRIGLVLLALAFCVYGLISQWEETRRALTDLSWPAVGGALVAGIGGLVTWMLGWRTLLAGLGSPLSLSAASRVTFISQLGKYVPGKVWALVAQVELAHEHDVPRIRSVSTTLLAVAVTLATSLAVASVTLPLTSAAAIGDYWWLFPLAPVFLITLHPRIVTWCLNLALRIVRRPQLERPVSMGTTLRAIGWTTLGWALFGTHIWLIALAAGGVGDGLFVLALGAYALAFTVGFLVFFAPGGIGPREAALVVVLSPVLPAGAPLVVAIVSRLALTIGDLVLAGFAVLLGGRPPAIADRTRVQRETAVTK